jgi:hypothetical protein
MEVGAETFVSIAVTDDYSANNAVERMRTEADRRWLSLHVKRCVHKVFNVAKHMIALTEDQIPGAAHFILCFMMAGAINKFRSELAAIIDARLDIRLGICTDESAN